LKLVFEDIAISSVLLQVLGPKKTIRVVKATRMVLLAMCPRRSLHAYLNCS
jgi:hypothetical protein